MSRRYSWGAPGSTGAASALRRATLDSGGPAWEVIYNPKAPLCTLQWAPHRAIRWERVMDKQRRRHDNTNTLVASHYYARAGLLRRVELSTTLAAAGITGVGLTFQSRKFRA